MRDVIKFLCGFLVYFGFFNAYAYTPVDGILEIPSGGVCEETINVDSSYLAIINHGQIVQGINVEQGVSVIIQNYGEISGEVTCSNSLNCPSVSQLINGDGDINFISGLYGQTILVQNAEEINLADVIAIAGNAGAIKLENSGIIIDVGTIGAHPNIELDSTNGVNFIILGITEDWDETQPVLTGISNLYSPALHDVQFRGIDPMFIAGYDPNMGGTDLYVYLTRQTDYSVVFENELGDFLDDLRDDNPDDGLLGALDAARKRAELNDILARSVRTNPINLMTPVRSFNSFVLGEYVHDLDFGIVAEPFYIYSDDFSVIGGGVGVSGTVAKNLIGKFGLYAGKMDYSSDLDDFSAMIYGANFGALYKDSSLYARAVGALSSAKFSDINVFNGVRAVSDPNGISGAMMLDGGLVFRVWNNLDITPFLGARFDYAKVLHFTDTDTNLRFGLNIDKETVVDGNKYAFGVQVVGQTNGEIYGAIYTDIMSVVDGVGGRLSFGILHNDDSGMSYKIALDAKFVF